MNCRSRHPLRITLEFILAIVVIGAVSPPVPARAQPLPDPRVLPGRERPAVPEPERASDRVPILPPAPLPSDPAPAWSRGLSVEIRMIEVAGNTVFRDREIVQITQGYVGRLLVSEDLLDLQRRLTRLYVEAGYVTSFAEIPDQSIEGGRLRIQIREGRLADIEIVGNRQFAKRYLERRLVPSPDTPLHVPTLERRLQTLQLDPRIEAVAGEPRVAAAIELSLIRQSDRKLMHARRYESVELQTRDGVPESVSAMNSALKRIFDQFADDLAKAGRVSGQSPSTAPSEPGSPGSRP